MSRLLVAQSGGCTAVINSSLIGVIDEAREQSIITSIYGARFGIRGILDQSFIDLGRQSQSILQRVRRTPSAALGSARYKLSEDECLHVVETLRRHEIDMLLFIGGNDSADTAHRLGYTARQQGVDFRVVAIPKTIDNDLPETDHCPGYGSAARFLAQGVLDGGRDAEAMCHWDPVKIVEVMGRDAGWLAAATVLGARDERDAPHLVYVPERPFDLDDFLQDVAAVHARLGYCVAVVAETVRNADGQPVGGLNAAASHDAFGHPVIAGTAASLCAIVGERLGLKARFDKPGTMQRMSMALVSETDWVEAYEAGRAGVRAAVEGHSEVMVTLQRISNAPYLCSTGLTSVEKIANRQRLVPPEFLHAERPWVSEEFLTYAKPLLGAPLLDYARLEDTEVLLSRADGQ